MLNLLCFWLFGKIVDQGTAEGRYTLVAAFSAVLAARYFCDWSKWVENIRRVTYPFEMTLYAEAFAKAFDVPLSLMAERLAEDRETVRRGASAFPKMVQTIVFDILPIASGMAIAVIGIAWIQPVLGLVLLAGFLGYVRRNFAISKGMLPDVKELERHNNEIEQRFWERFDNAREVVLAGKQGYEVASFRAEFAKFEARGKKLWLKSFSETYASREPISFLTLATLFFLSLVFADGGIMTKGQFLVVMTWSFAGFASMGSIGSIQRDLLQAREQIARFFEYLDQSPSAKKRAERDRGIRAIPAEGDIVFENVSFRYPDMGGDRDYTVENLCLIIPHGKNTVIVGPSGSGKSTLIALIAGIIEPEKGRITVGGLDLRDIDHDSWLRSLGIVEQRFGIWQASLGYNLAYSEADPDKLDREYLMGTLRNVRLTHLSPDDPLEFRIASNGANLSGGERQRLAIGRAIVPGPDVLLMDEPMSALDPMNRRLLDDAIKAAVRGRTCIMSTHNLDIAREADQIVVMEEGRIVGAGTHSELLDEKKACDMYCNLILRSSEEGTLRVVMREAERQSAGLRGTEKATA
ncbi:MAG TPA: ABC transporter ATP-binding protein [Candidatus Paceibacterota bacterium]|nr:ABC transporter ATP-binding protein [Candidatus Paceibacterota bacterium]